MKQNFSISIKSPCQENFESFEPTQKGGFCDSCQKEVIDFTKMSSQEILAVPPCTVNSKGPCNSLPSSSNKASVEAVQFKGVQNPSSGPRIPPKQCRVIVPIQYPSRATFTPRTGSAQSMVVVPLCWMAGHGPWSSVPLISVNSSSLEKRRWDRLNNTDIG